mgnify:CR=1 FL=1
MNIIGIMGPKLVTLLTILIPSIDTRDKIVLILIWFIKLTVDYDAARPGHSGNVYKLTKNVNFEVGELIVSIFQFIPAAAFLLAVILMRTWIPFVPGVVSASVYFYAIVSCIKDIIVEGKRRKARNANPDNQK